MRFNISGSFQRKGGKAVIGQFNCISNRPIRSKVAHRLPAPRWCLVEAMPRPLRANAQTKTALFTKRCSVGHLLTNRLWLLLIFLLLLIIFNELFIKAFQTDFKANQTRLKLESLQPLSWQRPCPNSISCWTFYVICPVNNHRPQLNKDNNWCRTAWFMGKDLFWLALFAVWHNIGLYDEWRCGHRRASANASTFAIHLPHPFSLAII